MWNPSLLAQTAEAAGPEGRVAVLVGDFRFGNGILLEDPLPSGTLVDGYAGIDAAAITPANDRAMLDRGLAGMRAWDETFGVRARYVLWDAFGRQIHDRLAGRHIADGPYRHPVFNYDEIAAALSHLDIVDLAPLLQLPMHEVSRLFIDDTNCPSQIGYLLLNGLIFDGLDAREAYDRAVGTVESELLDLARGCSRAAGGRLLLTGRSVWLDTLSRYMGVAGSRQLAAAGLILAPLDRVPGQRTPAQMVEEVGMSACAVAVVSAGGSDLSAQLARAFGTEISLWENASVIDWERATESAIRYRDGVPSFARLDANLPVWANAFAPRLEPSEIELGSAGAPSWEGIVGLLGHIARLDWTIAEEQPLRLENDVLITRSGVAFLAGGGHRPLRFASGRLLPSTKSLQTFSANITGRSRHAQSLGIPYSHTVFPDKQSILRDVFPLRPVTKLGDAYLDHMAEEARSHVVYPAAVLETVDDACLPLDTHLSDMGSLVVLRLILDAVGIDAPDALNRVESRISKPRRWAGDLGGKLDPPVFQEAMTLDPDWQFTELSSGGGFNDGLIDILLSPSAPCNRTALVFGDSFYRLMLRHLSGIFTRVISLRTRFYHREMVELIEPDFILTGNAERYLSRVDSDDEAIPFMLYRPVRGIAEQFDPAFLEAWRSITSPRAGRSIAYLEDQRVARTTS